MYIPKNMGLVSVILLCSIMSAFYAWYFTEKHWKSQALKMNAGEIKYDRFYWIPRDPFGEEL